MQIREKVDALRKEKKVFDLIYDKLELELESKMHTMSQKIEEAEKKYQAREQKKIEIEKIKALARQEEEEFLLEYKRLEKLIEKDKQVRDFIKTSITDQNQNRANH